LSSISARKAYKYSLLCGVSLRGHPWCARDSEYHQLSVDVPPYPLEAGSKRLVDHGVRPARENDSVFGRRGQVVAKESIRDAAFAVLPFLRHRAQGMVNAEAVFAV
jgi:hypothetical protein